MSARTNKVSIRFSDQELARLDELRGNQERPVFIRHLLREPPSGDEVATRSEVLAILSNQARDGKVTAAIALAKELREGEEVPEGELARLLRD